MRVLTMTVLSLLALPAFAGEEGIAPGDGFYGFKRTDPPPSQIVGTAKFEDGKTMVRDPGPNGNGTEWSRNSSTGAYDHPGGHLSICIHNGDTGDPAYVYAYKLDGVEVSSGDLED